MVNVAILGFGTVGSGVAEVLTGHESSIRRKADGLIRLKYILDVRDFPDSPFADRFVKDFGVIENDPEVDIVVETIGGATVALDFTRRALEAGKSVVTSNKELVATRGYELTQLAREKGVCYLFEASVGGRHPHHPAPVPVPGGQRDFGDLRHPERHHQLYPHPDDPGGAYL